MTELHKSVRMEVPPLLLVLCLTTLPGKLFPRMRSHCPFPHLVTFFVTLPLLWGSDEAMDDCSYLTRHCSPRVSKPASPAALMCRVQQPHNHLGGPFAGCDVICWDLLDPGRPQTTHSVRDVSGWCLREKLLLLRGWWLLSSPVGSLIYHWMAVLSIICDPRKSETVFPLVTWLLNRVVVL